MRLASRLASTLWLSVTLCAALTIGGCGDTGPGSATETPPQPPPGSGDSGVAPDALLDSAVQLLQATQRDFVGHQIAAQRLNQYLLKSSADGQSPLEPLPAKLRNTLSGRFSDTQIRQIEGEQFDRPDAMHLEACFLRRDVAKHATAGLRTDMEKVEAIFDWVIRNVQVVGPDESPASIRVPPSVTLLLGRGTETERAWVFMELLRQVGVESVMVASLQKGPENRPAYVDLMPAALIGESLYLFDTTIGLPIPGPDEQGVATLKQVVANPELLSQLDLGSEHPYRVHAEHLQNLVILFEATPGYWAPRMRFLQERLSGENKAVLWSDFLELYERVGQALPGDPPRDFWPLPKIVDEVSRTPEYMDQLLGGRGRLIGILTSYQFFASADARVAQLNGRLVDAIPVYMSNRVPFQQWAATERNQSGLRAMALNASAPAPPDPKLIEELVAKMGDLYESIREDSTYFLGVAKFEQREYGPAATWMGKSYRERYPSGRWTSGALYHLARCAEMQNDVEKAIEYYTENRTSPQAPGNLIRARRLGWEPDTDVLRP